MRFYHWLGRESHRVEAEYAVKRTNQRFPKVMARLAESEQPICDGDFTEEEHIEDDGFITVYFSGPIRPIQS